MSSVTIQKLQEGQRYCVQTQYLLYSSPVGPRSCIYCQLVPESSKNFCPHLCRQASPGKSRCLSPPELKSNQLWLIAVVLLITAVPTTVYMFMCRCGRIKRWLHSNRYSIPAHVSVQARTHARTEGWL